MDDLAHIAVDLMQAIDLQIRCTTAEYTPWRCPGCGACVFGRSECPKCLTKKLGYIVGNECARAYLTASIAKNDAFNTVMEKVGVVK